MPSITAILTVYRRPQNLARQVESIRRQTVPIQAVWAWANAPANDLSTALAAFGLDRVVTSSQNAFFHGRFALALLAQTEYVALFDDDTIPGERWLANCLETMARSPGILGTAGVVLHGPGYANRTMHGWQRPSDEPVEVDLVGQGWFLRTEWLKHLFAAPAVTGTNGEDIELAARCWRLAGVRSFCPPHPASDTQRWGSLAGLTLGCDEQASSMRVGHVEERERIVQAELAAGWQPLFMRPSVDSRTEAPTPNQNGHKANGQRRGDPLGSEPSCERASPIDTNESNDPFLDAIPHSARRILDCLAGSGTRAAQVISRQDCLVSGFVATEAEASIARKYLADVFVGDPETTDPTTSDRPFDCILLDGGLDRVRDATGLLRRARTWLSPDGQIVIQVANARHHRVIQALLEGAWDRAVDPGTPDRPLRFWTRRELEKTCFRAGFHITDFQPTPSAEIDSWRACGRPATVTAGRLRIAAASPRDAEELIADRFIVRAHPAPQPDYGLTSIVIATFNQLAYTRGCLDSIRWYTDEPYELVVVDNGSTDGSIEFLRSQPDVRLIENAENRGFPAAANQGIRASRGRQVLLLNNDVLVTTGWLERLLAALYSHDQVGLAGPCSNCVSGGQQVSAGYPDLACLDGFAWDRRVANFDRREQADRLVGFCLLIRRQVLDQIGVLDERFGIGNFEDDDFCRRAQQAGYKLLIARDSFVHHFGHVSFDGNNVDLNDWLDRNQRVYADKWRQPDAGCSAAPDQHDPVTSAATAISVPDASTPGLEQLRRDHPWPSEKPIIAPPEEHLGWLGDGAREAIAAAIDDNTKLVVELGSWLGLSARHILGCARNATVITIDHFQGSAEHQADPEWQKMLPTLYESFLTLNWPLRERIVPLRMTTQEGLKAIARHGLSPDVIYFDADHSFPSLMADLELVRELFPQARLIGDDFDAKGVGEAMAEFSLRHDLTLTKVGTSWRAWRLESPNNDVSVALSPDPPITSHADRRSPPNADVLAPASAPIKLSLCMIVRDNERTIRAALESIRPWVDEMVVVDTGSRDRTPEICQELGAKIFHFPWLDSFSVARNESLQHACGEWIFWMDSDDVKPEDCGRKLRNLVLGPHDPNCLGYVVQVHCPGPGPDGQHDVTVVDHVKLFRNRPDLRFEFRIHEQIIPAIRRAGGEVQRTDLYVVHSGADHTAEGRQRKLQRDLRLLELDLQERPDHPFVLFNLGMTHADAEQPARAVECLVRCLAVADPSESQVRKAHALLVSSYTQLEQWNNAWRACQAGRAAYPKDVELLFREGMLHQQAGRLADAERSYLAALANDDVEHYGSIDRGIVGFKARHNLAVVYTEMSKPELAEGQWRQAITEVPTYRDGWHGLARNLIQRGRLNEVDAILGQMSVHPSLRSLRVVLSAELSEARGDPAAARRILEQGVREFPDDPEPLRGLCQILFFHGRPEEAAAALEGLLRRVPDDASAWHNLGTVHMRSGRFVEAAQALGESLRHRRNSPLTARMRDDALLTISSNQETASSGWRIPSLDPAGPRTTSVPRELAGEVA